MTNHEDEATMAHALGELASILNRPELSASNPNGLNDVIFSACQFLGANLGITIIKPLHLSSLKNPHDMIMAIANSSQLRVRKVSLKGQWWNEDNGPILTFNQRTNQPVCLIRKTSYYEMIDPQTGQHKLFDPIAAPDLSTENYIFYPAFPATVLTLKHLLRFAFTSRKPELIRVILLQVGMGLLGLIFPIATSILLNQVIPNAEYSLFWQWIFGLSALILGNLFFMAAQTLALIRLRFKINAYTQAAVWDRLLRLPLTFFNKFSPGDLTLRASGIDTIQQTLPTAIIQALLGGIFSIFLLILMCYYSPILAGLIFLIFLIIAALSLLNAYIQLKYQKPMAFLQGKLAALTLQFITGISKLRVTQSEVHAFDLWSQSFANRSSLSYKSSLRQLDFSVATALLLLLGVISIYGLVGSGLVSMNFGNFIAFNAAYGQFLAALFAFVNVFVSFIAIIPQYERITPILQTLPEENGKEEQLSSLTGAISIREINFYYHAEEAQVLHNITLDIKPGQKVAFVGPTGCGKSTLIRLLLGFNLPISGKIFYDEYDISLINPRRLREQLGVVLQNTSILPGTLWENIKGTTTITMEEVWQAAAYAGLAEEIKDMPMGMQTAVGEGGKNLSVGQRQRLMIARALVRKPRILIFDEATSALDSPAEAQIMRHLDSLAITRVLIAHRLSALRNMDQIYVMQSGKIVQAGNFQTLRQEPGLFSTLAKSQGL